MSSHQYERIKEDLLMSFFSREAGKGCIRVGECKQLLPERYLMFAKDIDEMEVRDDDIWVTGHIKTGTTWTQEMVWCIANNVDLETAKNVTVEERFPDLEMPYTFDFGDDKLKECYFPLHVIDTVKYLDQCPSPRFIKSHLQWSLLPIQIQSRAKKPKIVYVARNAKDTCVSLYHHIKRIHGFTGNLEDCCKLFLEDNTLFSPYWSHVTEFWKRREEENIMFIKYEDMKKDLPSIIRKVAEFLNKKLSKDQISRLNEHLSIDKMKNNAWVSRSYMDDIKHILSNTRNTVPFIRRGQIGSWREEMTEEMSKKFDEWTKEKLKNTGLSFDEQ